MYKTSHELHLILNNRWRRYQDDTAMDISWTFDATILSYKKNSWTMRTKMTKNNQENNDKLLLQ